MKSLIGKAMIAAVDLVGTAVEGRGAGYSTAHARQLAYTTQLKRYGFVI